jgi:hypothetical protein
MKEGKKERKKERKKEKMCSRLIRYLCLSKEKVRVYLFSGERQGKEVALLLNARGGPTNRFVLRLV